MNSIENNFPLCVDLDGALIKTDTLWESLVLALKRSFHIIFFLPFWIFKGKAFLKDKIADYAVPNPKLLPYRDEVLTIIRQAKEAKRKVFLVTAANELIANSCFEHLGCFDEVFSSTHDKNLKDKNKRDLLIEKFGLKGFDYCADSSADLPVWEAANLAIIVSSKSSIIEKAKKANQNHIIINVENNKFKSAYKSLRAYQWVKNFLLFLPILLAHKITQFDLLSQNLLGFVSFCLCASSVYIINDILDIESDRAHYKKKYRPFASGALQIKDGLTLAPLLIIVGFTISLSFLSLYFTIALAAYMILTSAYSLKIKRIAVLDILILAALYSHRILAGGLSAGVFVSPWLLAFSSFFFLSLAIAKRFAELQNLLEFKKKSTSGRGYEVGDIDLLRSIGPLSGYISALVFVFYVNSAEVKALYKYPQALWLVAPCLIYWITRLWLLAHRGKLEEDPVVFAVKDKFSYFIGAIVLAILAFANLLS